MCVCGVCVCVCVRSRVFVLFARDLGPRPSFVFFPGRPLEKGVWSRDLKKQICLLLQQLLLESPMPERRKVHKTSILEKKIWQHWLKTSFTFDRVTFATPELEDF